MAMDVIELNEKIDRVFNHEASNVIRDGQTYRFIETGEGVQGITLGYISPLIEKEPEKHIIDFPAMETLKKLYLSIEHSLPLKRCFVEELIRRLHSNQEGSYLDVLPFATLIYTNNKDEALTSLTLIKSGIKLFCLLCFIKIFLRCNYHYLNNQQLKFLRDYFSKIEFNIDAVDIEINHILQQIDKILFDNLNKELEGINFEINQDKEKVIDKAKYYGFDKKIVEALKEIDDFIYLENSKIITSGIVSDFREMFATLVENICNKIKEITKEEYPSEVKTKIGNLRIYLKKHLQLSDKEHSFINRFVDLLQQEGGHSFMSEKEYFRLARNIFITIAYFLLSKLDKFIAKND